MMAAAITLAAAFADDPFYNAITVDFAGAERVEILRNYFEDALGEAERIGRNSIDPDGVAIWTLPQPPDVAEAESVRKAGFLETLLGPRGLRNYRGIIGFMSAQSQDAGAPAAWYLSILGVAPEAQGRGLATRLLAPTLAEADALGQQCTLETFKPDNVRFYTKRGFAVQSTHVEPFTGRTYWVMRRDAASAR